MTTEELNELLDEAIKIWADLTGIDPNADRWTLGSLSLRDQTKDITHSRDLDPTGLTTFMLLKVFTHGYIEQEQVTALDLIRGLSDEQRDRIAQLRQVYEFFERPVVDEYVAEFVDRVRAGVSHYGLDAEAVETWLTSPLWMAVLRRDALQSMERLRPHQFCFGEPATGKVQYSEQVWEFWNMPSLVRAMQAQGARGIPSINLCLVRDPEDAIHSFFVLCVVNGQSLTVLTDRERAVHPNFKRMARCPAKDFVRRAHKHWFPYELLDIEISANQKHHYSKPRTSLVPINTEATPLRDFAKLDPPTVIWLMLLFDLIEKQYFVQHHRLPDLSYTTEMIRNPEAIVEPGSALVVAGHYRPLDAPDLTHEDITTEKLAAEGQWDSFAKLKGHNQWMLDRYGDQVPAEVFNVIGRAERLALPGHNLIALEDQKPDSYFYSQEAKKLLAEQEGTEVELAITEIGLHGGLQMLDPLDFGTSEEIEKDRKWTARMNHCKVVQRLAMREYDRTKDSLLFRPRRFDQDYSGWWYDRVRERRDFFIELAVRGELIRETDWWWKKQSDFQLCGLGSKDPGELKPKPVNLVRVGQGKNWPAGDYFSHGKKNVGWPGMYLSEMTGKSVQRYCCLDGTTASYHATINPIDAIDLALLLGCEVEDLPWQLQVWTKSRIDYHGNPILNRLDPAEWVLKNPWVGDRGDGPGGLDLSVGVSLSKRAVNRLRKKIGLPPFRWTDFRLAKD